MAERNRACSDENAIGKKNLERKVGETTGLMIKKDEENVSMHMINNGLLLLSWNDKRGGGRNSKNTLPIKS